MPEKGCYIKDIRENQPVEGVFLVKSMARAETKAGKPYLMLTVMDRTGEISTRVWDNADALMPECETGGYITLAGQSQAYKGILQLKIDKLRKIDPETIDPALFMPSTPGDINAMSAELQKLIKTVDDPNLRDLLLAFFKNRKIFTLFKQAPAAKAMHHAYHGGLLEHTLGVARLASMLCELYPTIDRSLLVTAALLHDIGKLEEFSFDTYPFDYSDRGRLVGHMMLGIEMIQQKIDAIPSFPDESATRLKHLILSHHGRHEFGSPVLPMMLEAFVLHFIDDLDAKINYFNTLSAKSKNEGYEWSEFQRTLERFLYIRGRNGGDDLYNGTDGKDDFDPRQGNLF